MEEAAVNNRVEVFVQSFQRQGVPDDEAGGDAPIGSLAPGDLDGPGRCINTRRFEASRCGHQRVFTGSAAGVEDATPYCALLGEPGKDRLRPSDVPRRRSHVAVVKVVDTSVCRSTGEHGTRWVSHWM
jgi:hypothetical protein